MSMEESEKMVALQKAYADIILNTAKEAAARIMVSERRAVRFELDLNSTKDEASRLLLRLKQMINSKTKEAEITSVTQQRKIDELEAQLHEAEDVITDLRAELRWVRNKLEKAKNNQLQLPNVQIKGEDTNTHTAEPIIPSILNSGLETIIALDMENTLLNQKILDNRCCSQTLQTSNKDVGKHTVPSPKIKNMELTKRFSGVETKKPFKVRTSRRRKTRFGKSKANLRRSRPGQPIKPCHSSSVPSRSKTYSLNGNVRSEVSTCPLPSVKAGNTDNMKNSSGLDEKLQHKSGFNEHEIKIIHKGKRTMKVQSRDVTNPSFVSPDQLIKPCQTTSVVNHGMVYSFAVRGNVKSGEDRGKIAENEAKMRSLPRLDPGLTLIRSGVNPVSGSTSVTVSVKALNKSRLVQDASGKDTELRDESTMVKPEGDALDNLMVVCSELNPDLVNVPLVLSELRDDKSFLETNGSPSKSDGNRFLRYTFQRKRKKESLSNSDGNTSPDKTIVKKRTTEKPDDPLEPQKSSLINASSRDSRRMAQVALQVISSSGKKC